MADRSEQITIRHLQGRAVMAPLARPITTSSVSIPEAPLVLIDLECDEEIVGRSYLFAYTPLALTPLVDLISNLSDVVKGTEVAPQSIYRELEEQFCLLGRQGLLGMALSGLDMACWDALGKSANLPVSRLLGSDMNPIGCYDSHGLFDPNASPQHLEQSLKTGFTAVKFKIGGGSIQQDVDAVKCIREIVGPEVKVMVDYNQSLTVPEAIERIRRLEPFELHWVEEPVEAEDLSGHAQIRRSTNTSIQTGENWWFPRSAATAFAMEASDHAMLDIMKIGGVTGWMQAAALAQAASAPVSSHLFVEASSHVLAATSNAHLLEYLDVASAVLTEPYRVSEGKLASKGPGLGLEWNESAIGKFLC